MTQLHARPNMNGNTSADFQRTALAVQEVAGAVSKLIGQISGNIVHGRNYQTLDHPDQRRTTDLAHITRLAEIEWDLRELAIAIFDASNPNATPTHLSIKLKKAS